MRFILIRFAFFGAIIFLLAGAHTYAGWTTINAPGDFNTAVYGIDGDRIVGSYYYYKPVENGILKLAHGFLYDGTNWETLDYPGATGTVICDVDGNRIVGSYYKLEETDGFLQVAHGFLSDGTNWVTIDYPGAAWTKVDGIVGDSIFGCYSNTPSAIPCSGFVYDGIDWVTLDYPEASMTWITDIESDKIIGNCFRHGFLYDEAGWTALDYPGADWTRVGGIDGDRIAGYYPITSSFAVPIFPYTWQSDIPIFSMRDIVYDEINRSTLNQPGTVYIGSVEMAHCRGFVYDGTNWSMLNYPGAVSTWLYGIDGDKIVGSYLEQAGTFHGFVYDPNHVYEPIHFKILDAEIVASHELSLGIDIKYPSDSDDITNENNSIQRMVKVTIATKNDPKWLECEIDITEFTQPGISWGPGLDPEELMYDEEGNFLPDRTPLRIDFQDPDGDGITDDAAPRFEQNEELTISGIAYLKEFDPQGNPLKTTLESFLNILDEPVEVLLPVFIIHGYIDTLTSYGWIFENFRDVAYDKLVQFLTGESVGYSEDDYRYKTLWTTDFCTYRAEDETPESIVEKFDVLFELARMKSYANKANIIGHCFGGLVARYYAGESNNVDKVITVATPHLGACKLYQQGFLEETRQDAEKLLRINQNENSPYNLFLWSEPNFETSSLIEEDNAGNWTLLDEPFDTAPGGSYESYCFNPIYNDRVQYFNIFMSGLDTPEALVLKERASGSSWYTKKDEVKGDGDGTVLTYSSSNFPTAQSYHFESDYNFNLMEDPFYWLCYQLRPHVFLLNRPDIADAVVSILTDREVQFEQE